VPVAEKVANARRNLAEAGLADFVDIRQGDGWETLPDLGGPVNFVLIDGWPGGKGPSLARQVIEIAAPQSELGWARLGWNSSMNFKTALPALLLASSPRRSCLVLAHPTCAQRSLP